MTSYPTPEQRTRAAELAPCVAAIVGIDEYLGSLWTGGGHAGLLDPRAFQAVVLALPEDSYNTAAEVAAKHPDSPPRLLPFTRWLITPAGMLAFYEALVEGAS